MEKELEVMMKEAALAFAFSGTYLEGAPYGSGHINDTFLVHFAQEEQTVKRYILQRMNRHVFLNPVELMENVVEVTVYLRRKIEEKGGDPARETLNVIPTRDGNPYYVDSQGEYWRAYAFIEHAVSLDKVETPEEFYESGFAFGKFQRMLADYPADTLHETIPGFHNTQKRYQTFLEVMKADIKGRAHLVSDEINFVLHHEELAKVFTEKLAGGELPLRVTHNDTKLNNIMLDETTKKGICVIDLDTVMPGLSAYDFGDAIRFGASTAAEDETDLDKVWCDMDLFSLYTKGFLDGCGGSLTEEEVRLLPMGAKVMTFECGMRFLTDYLQGDTYFKIHRGNHNLDRCRTQFKLVQDMEQKWETMMEIVERYLA